MSAFMRSSLLYLLASLTLAHFLSFAILASAQGLSRSSLQPRIATVIDESSLVTLRGNTHPLAREKYDRGPAPISMPANRLLLVLARSTQQEADLQTFLQSVQDFNSPNYHKFMKPEEFGKTFGVGDSDLQTIQAWLTGHGFTVSKVAEGRMAIEFSGTVDQVQSAFHTSLHSYVINEEQHWANATDPQIPSALAPVLAGLASLNSFKPKAQYIRGPSGIYNAKTHTIKPAYTWTDIFGDLYFDVVPADADTIYDVPNTLNANFSGRRYDGTGVTIGAAGDSNIDITQNANYSSIFGLNANAVTVVVDGNDPGETDDAWEAYLDTEVAQGIAPGANVILYTAANTYYEAGLFLAIQRALDDNQVDILDVGFGACESAQGATGNQYISNLWEQAAAQGISVTVPSGESGSADCDNPDTEDEATQGLAVNALSSTPYNISVGGTDFDILYSNYPGSYTAYIDMSNTLPYFRSALGYIPEEPWNNSTTPNADIAANQPYYDSLSISAAGGGISSVYPVPTWQAGVASGTGRNLPDVSFLAGNGFYSALWGLCTDVDYQLYTTPIPDCAAGSKGTDLKITGAGGTSAAAPAFAGMLALVKQKTGARLGQADYALYNLAETNYAAIFHDVTVGDNSVTCMNGSPDCLAAPCYLTIYCFMSGYNATTGYDLASGLGSVDASQLVNNWASAGLAATNSSLQLNGATTALIITHGQSVAVNASVTSASGTPAGNIALVDSLSPALLPNHEGIANFPLSGGTASGTTNSLPGGAYNVSAHYGGSNADAESDSKAIPVTVAAETSSTSITQITPYDPATGNPSTTPYYGFIYAIDAQPYGNSSSLANPNGAATGAIKFMDDGKTLGTASLSSAGIAELKTSSISTGVNSVTAVFPGDSSFQASTSAPYSLTVVRGVTYMSIPQYVPVSATHTVTLVCTVSFDSVAAAPTGTVTFQTGSTVLGSAPLVGAATGAQQAWGTASFTTAPLPPGTYNFSAVYSGDGNFDGYTQTAQVTVFPTGTITPTVTVRPSASSITTTQALTVMVAVSAGTGNPTPTGSVVLSGGYYTSGAVTLTGGGASISVPAGSLDIGFNTLVVTYTPDFNSASTYYFATGISLVNVTAISPTVTVTPSSSSITAAQGLTVMVAVSGGTGNPTPTGSVVLSGGHYTSATVSLTGGSASIGVPAGSLAIGSDTLFVTYLPDSNSSSIYCFDMGTSSVTVTRITPTVTVTPSSSSITTAQVLTVTVAVSGTPTPTGSVVLSSGSYTSGAVTLSGGSASISVPAGSLAVGSDTLTATYTPDSNSSSTYNSATGTNSVTVTRITPTVTVTPSASSITAAQVLTVTVAVSGTPTPTGSVVLNSGSYTSAAVTQSGGGASISVPAGSLAIGSDTLTATYTPDSNSSSTYNSAAGTSSVTVTRIMSTVTVTPSPNPVTTVQTLAVKVCVSDTPTPTGSVTLTSDGHTSAATALTGGCATIGVPAGSLEVGTETLTANYTPDSNSSSIYTSATGTSQPVTVTKATPTVTATPSQSDITAAQPLTVTVAVSGGKGTPMPAGSVTLTGGGYTSPATTLSSGAATITIPAGSLAVGVHTLTASYSGDSNYFSGLGTASVTLFVPTTAALTSPAKGTAPCGGTTFKWTAGSGPTAYWLYLGTTGVGGSNLYSSGSTTALSETVSVPCDGVKVFARLMSRINGTWVTADYTYTEGGTLVKAAITSPANGSVLPGPSVKFNWAGAAGPSAYWLYLGTKGVGSDDLYNSGSTTATSATVSGLPTTGAMVYAKFLQHIDGAWQTTYYTYWGGTPTAATLTTPTAGTLCGSTSFAWPTNTGPSAYWLELGTVGVDSNNLYSSGSTTAGSEKVSVPCDGVTVWVTLMSRLNGAWQTEGYTYTEKGTLVKAAITSPTNKRVLPGSSVKFSWAGGAGPSEYWLYLGTTGEGSSNLYNSGATTATSATVSGLPTNGKTVYAKFLQRINGAWQTTYYTYTAQ